MIKKINAKAIVDVINQQLIEDASIVIQDGIIVWVGQSSDCPSYDTIDEQINLSHQFVLPGLINAHLHLGIKPITTDPKDFFESFSRDPIGLLAIYAAQNAKTELLSGVTTIRDCGAPGNIIEHLRVATTGKSQKCPRLFHCGPILTVTGGHGHDMGAEADGEAAVQKKIRHLFQQGADFIKIAATGGGTPGTDPCLSYFSEGELKTIVSTAHQLKLKVAAHVRGVDGVKDTIQAGVDSIEHCDFEYPGGRLSVLPDHLNLMAEKSIYLVPTIQLYQDLMERGLRENQPQADVDTLKAAVEQKCKALAYAMKVGVKVAAGNDGGLPDTTFGELWKELVIMSHSGMTNMQVIQSATSEAAKLLSCDDITGSIEVGKSADLIAVRDNPLENLKTLEVVDFVMKEGNLMKNQPTQKCPACINPSSKGVETN